MRLPVSTRGMRVTLVNLTGRADLNGKQGTVTGLASMSTSEFFSSKPTLQGSRVGVILDVGTRPMVIPDVSTLKGKPLSLSINNLLKTDQAKAQVQA